MNKTISLLSSLGGMATMFGERMFGGNITSTASLGDAQSPTKKYANKKMKYAHKTSRKTRGAVQLRNFREGVHWLKTA